MERSAKSRLASFLLIFVFLGCVTYAFGLLTSVRKIPSIGTVKTIGVGAYWDVNCTSKVTEIDWGLLEPGETSNVTVYIKNEGNAPHNSILEHRELGPIECLRLHNPPVELLR